MLFINTGIRTLAQEIKKEMNTLFSILCKTHKFVNMTSEADKCVSLIKKLSKMAKTHMHLTGTRVVLSGL